MPNEVLPLFSARWQMIIFALKNDHQNYKIWCLLKQFLCLFQWREGAVFRTFPGFFSLILFEGLLLKGLFRDIRSEKIYQLQPFDKEMKMIFIFRCFLLKNLHTLQLCWRQIWWNLIWNSFGHKIIFSRWNILNNTQIASNKIFYKKKNYCAILIVLLYGFVKE